MPGIPSAHTHTNLLWTTRGLSHFSQKQLSHNSGLCRDLGNTFSIPCWGGGGELAVFKPPCSCQGRHSCLGDGQAADPWWHLFIPARSGITVWAHVLRFPLLRLSSPSCNSRAASGPINQGLFPANTVCCFPQGNSFTGGESDLPLKTVNGGMVRAGEKFVVTEFFGEGTEEAELPPAPSCREGDLSWCHLHRPQIWWQWLFAAGNSPESLRSPCNRPGEDLSPNV